MKKLLFIIILTTSCLAWNLPNSIAQVPFTTPDNIGSGNCLSFDGIDDFIDLNYSSDNLNSPVTFMTWINPATTGRGALISAYNPCCSGNPDPERWDLEFDSQGNQKICWQEHGGVKTVCSTASINLDTWTHIAVVHDQPGGEITFYVNGVSSGSHVISLGLKSNIDVSFGARNNGNGAVPFHGLLDEICIWDKVLSQNEIRDIMCKKLTGNELDLIGYWDMNEGTGTTINDLTSNGNDGTLQ